MVVLYEREADTAWRWAMTPHTCMSTINPPTEITLTALSNLYNGNLRIINKYL